MLQMTLTAKPVSSDEVCGHSGKVFQTLQGKGVFTDVWLVSLLQIQLTVRGVLSVPLYRNSVTSRKLQTNPSDLLPP
jgi:hypothetical protein